MPKQAKARRKVIQLMEIHRTPGEVFRRVAVDKEQLVVERGGYPIAVILPYEGREEIEGERLLDELAAELEPRAKAMGLTEEQVIADLHRIRKKYYQKKYGKAAK